MAIAKLVSRKVSNNESDGYKTLKFQLLACGNPSENNNKFYCIEIQKHPDGEYRLFTHYGRIGVTNIYEVRDIIKGGTKIYGLLIIEQVYDSIIKKKLKGKSSSQTPYEIVDTAEPSVGSVNIRNTKVAVSSSKGDLKILSLWDDDIVRTMVRQVWEENIHNITNMTTMSVSSSGISSPLGPLTLSHLEKASDVLTAIKQFYANDDKDCLNKANAQYFSMIPHHFGMSISSSALINDDNKFMVEYDLLEQMKSVLQVTDDKEEKEDIVLPFEIARMAPTSIVYKKLEKQYIDSRADCHRHLNGWNVKNIFQVDHFKSTDNYEEKGVEHVLFHGSRSCNIFSIMMNGLMIPPKTAGHVTGRMFGDGIYAASASTKALNYATGYWGGGSNKYPEAYMFVVTFAMGEIYYPTGPKYDGAPQGFNSIWAKKDKTSLANDEFIVYNLNQAKLTHLIQLRR